jgi:hypothetical protein
MEAAPELAKNAAANQRHRLNGSTAPDGSVSIIARMLAAIAAERRGFLRRGLSKNKPPALGRAEACITLPLPNAHCTGRSD